MYCIIDYRELQQKFEGTSGNRGTIYKIKTDEGRPLPFIVAAIPPNYWSDIALEEVVSAIASTNSRHEDRWALVKAYATPSHVNYQLLTRSTLGLRRANDNYTYSKLALLGQHDAPNYLSEVTILALRNRGAVRRPEFDAVSALFPRREQQVNQIKLMGMIGDSTTLRIIPEKIGEHTYAN